MTRPNFALIDDFLYVYRGASNFSASGSSNNVTSALTTVLATAGRGGVSVPLQVATTGAGLITTAPNNQVKLIDRATRDTLEDGSGFVVYGKLTEAGGVYTLSYFSLASGSEAAYTFPSSTAIDFQFQYCFPIDRLPLDAFTSIQSAFVGKDTAGVAAGPSPKLYTEKLTVTALNTLSALTKTPDVVANIHLKVRGLSQSSLNGDFTVSGKTITWVPAAAGFNIQTSDAVIAAYTTLE